MYDLSTSLSSLPPALIDALAVYEPLSSAIARNYDLDRQLPVQRRLIAAIMHRCEVDRKELSRRESLVKSLLAQKDALSATYSLSALQASFWGTYADQEQKLRLNLLDARNSLEQIRKQVNETSDRLIKEINVMESMDERNTQLSKWRKELNDLMIRIFEDDKEDTALRLRIVSSKSNYASALDQMDRHKAAENELKTAKKLCFAALTLLNLLKEKDQEIPDWFRGKFIFDAKQLTTQADLFIQNAFSIDPTLPDHEPIPPPPDPPANSPEPSVTQALIRTLHHRSQSKLDRIATTTAYILAAKNTTHEALTRCKSLVVEAQEALNARRIAVMETVLEISKQSLGVEAVGGGAWKRECVLVASWMLPVEGVEEIDERSRPSPGPMRIVTEVPTAADVLPEYAP